jgi:hypothetical protein
MKTKTLLASMAVASLAFAQPVSAATRSSDSLPRSGVQSTAAAERIGSLEDEAEDLTGRPLLLILLLFGTIAALVFALSGSKSPG